MMNFPPYPGLIQESTLDFMVQEMIKITIKFSLDSDYLKRNSDELMKRYADELEREKEKHLTNELYFVAYDMDLNNLTNTISPPSSSSSLPSSSIIIPSLAPTFEVSPEESESKKIASTTSTQRIKTIAKTSNGGCRRRGRKKTSSDSTTSPTPTSSDRPFCTFCKNNGCSPNDYYSHILRDPETKKVICPSLRNYKCPYCGNTDKDFAHTKTHCPKRAAHLEENQEKGKPRV